MLKLPKPSHFCQNLRTFGSGATGSRDERNQKQWVEQVGGHLGAGRLKQLEVSTEHQWLKQGVSPQVCGLTDMAKWENSCFGFV